MRAGADPEVIAAETGWPIDKVMRYAGPPLAERSYVAGQALNTELRRTGKSVSLADTVAIAIAPDRYPAANITWDSYRREDGKWIVIASLPKWKHGTQASWSYDHEGHNLHPLDDVARRLMGVAPDGELDFITETPIAVLVEEAEVEIVADSRPRLVAVPALKAVESEHHTLMLPITEEEPSVPPARPAEKKPAKAKGKRASIPTWDEILFGTSRNDDL